VVPAFNILLVTLKKQARMKVMKQIPLVVLMMEKYVQQKFKKSRKCIHFLLFFKPWG